MPSSSSCVVTDMRSRHSTFRTVTGSTTYLVAAASPRAGEAAARCPWGTSAASLCPLRRHLWQHSTMPARATSSTGITTSTTTAVHVVPHAGPLVPGCVDGAVGGDVVAVAVGGEVTVHAKSPELAVGADTAAADVALAVLTHSASAATTRACFAATIRGGRAAAARCIFHGAYGYEKHDSIAHGKHSHNRGRRTQPWGAHLAAFVAQANKRG